jgi:hypothetical protein
MGNGKMGKGKTGIHRRTMCLHRVAVVRSGGKRINSTCSSLKFHQLVIFCSLKSQDNLNHIKSHFMYMRKRVICE